MKKRSFLVAVLALSMVLSGCGNTAGDNSGGENNTTEVVTEAEADDSADDAADDSKTDDSDDKEDKASEEKTTEEKTTEAEDATPFDAQISYKFASKEEGLECLMSNDAYYDGFSQNDLDYRMQKKDATMEEYKEFAKEQVLDFSDSDREIIDKVLNDLETSMYKNNLKLPEMDTITFIKTTMDEEQGAGGYTHGTEIYLGDYFLDYAKDSIEDYKRFKLLIAHELFHCITRNNPEFRSYMYSLIGFTVQDEDFVIPPSAQEYFISNPDVEHHNSYASFDIDGETIDCFLVFLTDKHFEEEGENFFDNELVGLCPIDGTDTYFEAEDADNFWDLFGDNTEYVVDPEECMADNFSFTLVYGKLGKGGKGYESQEIIDSIYDYLQK
ncbi:hypothetical protein SAMN02910369_02202 [Lachnospiraceae bacterium NE2001]|nr:hypothetical protein SAMN02910369_02202 [Lachnospiraceae bacterium NE2001]